MELEKQSVSEKRVKSKLTLGTCLLILLGLTAFYGSLQKQVDSLPRLVVLEDSAMKETAVKQHGYRKFQMHKTGTVLISRGFATTPATVTTTLDDVEINSNNVPSISHSISSVGQTHNTSTDSSSSTNIEAMDPNSNSSKTVSEAINPSTDDTKTNRSKAIFYAPNPSTDDDTGYRYTSTSSTIDANTIANIATTDATVTKANVVTTAMPVCSTSTRLAKLQSTCPSQSESMDAWLESLSLYELKAMTRQWKVDENHQVLACLHSKVSTTTWATILCNNSRHEPALPNRRASVWKCMARNGVYNLGSHKAFTKEDIVHRIKTYYKFMVVRHPLDRLLSAWRDKFENPKPSDFTFLARHGPHILQKYRPDNALTEGQIKAGKGVKFQELIQYILDGHRDAHWDGPYSQTCQPCRIKFDAVVKLETFDEDVTFIIDNKLEGRSKGTVANKNGKALWNNRYEKILEEFKHLSDSQLKSTVKKYGDDFRQFGYDFQRMDDGAVKLTCSISNGTTGCC